MMSIPADNGDGLVDLSFSLLSDIFHPLLQALAWVETFQKIAIIKWRDAIESNGRDVLEADLATAKFSCVGFHNGMEDLENDFLGHVLNVICRKLVPIPFHIHLGLKRYWETWMSRSPA